LLKHHCSATLHLLFDAETPRYALFISSELEHHCSAVLHLQHLLHLSLLPKHQSFTIVRQQAFTFEIVDSKSSKQHFDKSKAAATTGLSLTTRYIVR
jgi:hypothetical protein